jgi:hypothetical protein
MFNANDIQARLLERPFVPLRIVTSSGHAFDITHPELVLFGRLSLIVGTPCGDNPARRDDQPGVDPSH